MNYKKPAPSAAGTSADAPRGPGPLTPAERQRRHRAKVKATAAAHALTAAGRLVPENMRLVRQVECLAQEIAEHGAKALKSAAQIQQLQEDLDAERRRLQALRAMLRATLPRLTLAAAKQLRHALKEAGFIEWLDTG